ncbi:acyl-coenzyme A synthetase/AMP-(fatty) acid ligase/nucleoside-diphosphate-sugar epimerase/acyl carrier protein [Loktanella ponticola]|uniref:Acyl-coenzyme A synthetase/AMP-(Fatty) acid ligase/nucleoside-diphosphate-sugar epimerase/acyl carrier protein n=1 Tax=Yoonia ponticola TaxID=1524255 RepID=A0A7W9EWL9_9RHOB|nr:AMP-binding protein [Yoonia ponticola]MBB5720832.1 acyl-coenzyme A synthetase/AMP-(fatty) acid ligase/nucleoside-diphosphate-sugar epimerase/acyl carrier protein [Yoonia ponticola]
MTHFATDTASVPKQLAQALREFTAHTAFIDADIALTYGQVGCCIERLEQHLPTTESVAIFGKPSTVFATATTACLVLGRPFVHLDPAMPTDVLTNILAELDIDVIFQCQPAKDGQLPQNKTIVDVLDVIASPDDAPSAPIEAANVAANDAIYIVATSGTTGKPKCIPVTQEAAFLSYEWRDAYTPYDSSQTIGSYIFAIWEMFRPLRNGARICFPSFQQLLNPSDLAAFLIDYDVTEMLFTPSALEKTLQASTVAMTKDVPLKRIILNGEVVSDALIAAAREKLPNAVLWNLYSICETHDIAMTDVSAASGRNTGAVGIAMPHLRAVVLNDQDIECEVGEPGLLHFEGPRMLGPGYVNRAEETALRFREITLNGQDTRLYDTGDQGYVTPDGMIHVMGRIAHMLKLRGHSIQTRELTESMNGHMGFLQAVPWIQDVAGQGNALVFYYCANADQTAANLSRWGLHHGENRVPAALAKALRAELPAYCIPSYFIALDEIPINAVSGKCDFKSLPKVSAIVDDAPSDADMRPSVTESAKVLGYPVTMIDPSLSFHDHGGDSLMAVNLVLALEDAYNRRVDFDFALNVPLDRLHNILTETFTVSQVDGDFDRPGVLITGATGFLGQHVLAAVAKNLPDDHVIYCLVRAKRRDAWDRISEIANAHGVDPQRIILVPAALEDSRFGLNNAQYKAFCAATRSVIHCAAMVNLAVDPTTMVDWSKVGISNILQFCRDADADLRFSSTSAVFPDTGGPYPEDATTLYDNCGGYGAAKIAAEHMIATSGVASAIVRLPSLYQIEAPNPNDIYETIMSACAKMGAIPEDLTFRMIDVRCAAQFLADVPAEAGTRYFNLAPDRWITAADLPQNTLNVLTVQDWLDQAPLSPTERGLIAADMRVLLADSRFGHAAAAAAWGEISDLSFEDISDPAALLAHRFGH